MSRPLATNPCQDKCDWRPGAEVYQDMRVFECQGCGSEWMRDQRWTPRNADGAIAESVQEELAQR